MTPSTTAARVPTRPTDTVTPRSSCIEGAFGRTFWIPLNVCEAVDRRDRKMDRSGRPLILDYSETPVGQPRSRRTERAANQLRTKRPLKNRIVTQNRDQRFTWL